MPQAVAQAVGVREAPGRPLLAALTAALRSRRLLLVLDNCEHLLGACARLADALLRACPHLTILATSREALGLAGANARRTRSGARAARGSGVVVRGRRRGRRRPAKRRRASSLRHPVAATGHPGARSSAWIRGLP